MTRKRKTVKDDNFEYEKPSHTPDSKKKKGRKSSKKPASTSSAPPVKVSSPSKSTSKSTSKIPKTIDMEPSLRNEQPPSQRPRTRSVSRGEDMASTYSNIIKNATPERDTKRRSRSRTPLGRIAAVPSVLARPPDSIFNDIQKPQSGKSKSKPTNKHTTTTSDNNTHTNKTTNVTQPRVRKPRGRSKTPSQNTLSFTFSSPSKSAPLEKTSTVSYKTSDLRPQPTMAPPTKDSGDSDGSKISEKTVSTFNQNPFTAFFTFMSYLFTTIILIPYICCQVIFNFCVYFIHVVTGIDLKRYNCTFPIFSVLILFGLFMSAGYFLSISEPIGA